MPQWSPATYLKYSGERSRPYLDLVNRVPTEPRTIVDLGCGPGHLTQVLRERWPDAEVLGIDSSPEMVDRANAENTDPRASYALGDIATWTTDEPVDLIIANAAFQWVPTQLEVIPRLRTAVAGGGVLAFQVPNNFHRPSHVLLREIGGCAPYADHTADTDRGRGFGNARGVDAVTYLDLLADPAWNLDVWETTYLHVLPGDDPVFDWVSGTGARPYLQALPDDLREQFVADYKAALREAYPRHDYGTVLPFDRVFVVTTRLAGDPA